MADTSEVKTSIQIVLCVEVGQLAGRWIKLASAWAANSASVVSLTVYRPLQCVRSGGSCTSLPCRPFQQHRSSCPNKPCLHAAAFGIRSITRQHAHSRPSRLQPRWVWVGRRRPLEPKGRYSRGEHYMSLSTKKKQLRAKSRGSPQRKIQRSTTSRASDVVRRRPTSSCRPSISQVLGT